jgi:SAM-dependent methyltransferase
MTKPSQDTTPTINSEWDGSRGEKWLAKVVGMEALLAPVDEPLIRALQLDAPYRIAEVGSGGGATALAILHNAPAGSVVHGFDISPALVASARQRTPPGQRNLAFHVADMATATPPSEPYHRLVSRFGVMFFDDAPAAFANLVRWLAPGGRFAFAVWGPPPDNACMTTVRDVVAEIVAVPPPDPEAPGPYRYADASKLLRLLERAGFSELEAREWRGLLPIGGELSDADSAAFALAAFSTFGDLLARAGAEALQTAQRSLTTRFSRHHHDGAVRLGACIHIITGTRSAY